jgi:hypothetical protein
MLKIDKRQLFGVKNTLVIYNQISDKAISALKDASDEDKESLENLKASLGAIYQSDGFQEHTKLLSSVLSIC